MVSFQTGINRTCNSVFSSESPRKFNQDLLLAATMRGTAFAARQTRTLLSRHHGRGSFIHLNQQSTHLCRQCQLRASLVSPPTLESVYRQRRWASMDHTSTATAQAAESSETAQQPVNGVDITNHYTIFHSTVPDGPPPNSPFHIDQASLRREFLRLQNVIHPDKFPPGPTKERAEALSARINEAYRTLSDPLLRAQYLLSEWHGIDVTAEDGAAKHALDPETLMLVMEVQETVEELENEPAEEAEQTVARLRGENDERIQQSVERLAGAFDAGDIEAARSETVKLKFWYSLRDGLREWEPGKAEIRLVH